MMMRRTLSEEEPVSYRCQDSFSSSFSSESSCAASCVSLALCETCGCVTVPATAQAAGGPWGDFMDVFFGLLPIAFLLYATLKKQPLSTTRSLPLAALFMFLIRLMYFGSDPLLCAASIVLGLHEALTPLSIMAGAMTLFETMEATYCLPYMMREMKALTLGHPVAELMLIFAFAYVVEGASGFGTPAALAAPMLVSSGHAPLESVVVLLVMNTLATVWGAVGTPIWFGFGSLSLTETELLSISAKAAMALAVVGLLMMPLILSILAPWSMVRSNLLFVYLSWLSCVGPAVAMAMINYEFPSLVGGLVGCTVTAALIKFRLGLHPAFDPQDPHVHRVLGRHPSDIGSVSEHSLVRQHAVLLYAKSISSISDAPPERPGSGRALETVPEHTEPSTTLPLEADDAPDAENPVPDDKAVDHEENHINEVNVIENRISNVKVINGGQKPDEFKEASAGIAGLSIREVVDVHLGPRKSWSEGYLRALLERTFPIWGVILVLVLTRVQQIGIRGYLTQREPYFSIHFGSYGIFRLSVSLVFQLLNILTYPGINWKYELLFVPFLVPFILVSALTMFYYRRDLKLTPRQVAGVVVNRLKDPAVALMGALALVQLMIRVGNAAPANIVGLILAKWFKEGFVVLSPLLGALGSFFSGSTTVSNLTFGSVQKIAAESIGTSVTSMLALQTVGASSGVAVSLSTIIVACAVVGLKIGEGVVLFRTSRYVFSSTTIATIALLAFFFRFGGSSTTSN